MKAHAHSGRRLVALAAVSAAVGGLLGSGATAQVAYDSSMEGVAARVELVSAALLGEESDHPGCWEYVYDMYGGNQSWTRFATIRGFEADRIKNLHRADIGGLDLDGDGDANQDTGVWQRWDEHTVVGFNFWGGFQENSIYPSYWNGGAWELRGAESGGNWPGQNEPFHLLNEWHSGGDYRSAFGGTSNFRRYPGILADEDPAIDGNDAVTFDSFVHTATGAGFGNASLELTFRIVHPDPPGTIRWETWRNDGAGAGDGGLVFGSVVGPEKAGNIILEIEYHADADEAILTWTSNSGESYGVFFSTDLRDWSADLNDRILADEGETTTRSFDLAAFGLEDEAVLFFRVERNE